MKTFDEVDLSNAAQVYTVANTPLYLLRRLREDPAVIELAKSFDGETLLAELRRTLSVDPNNIGDYVRPYAYLVALSLMPEDAHLKAAAGIEQTKKLDWFDYLQRVLVATYSPSVTETMQAPGDVHLRSQVTRIDAPVEHQLIKVS